MTSIADLSSIVNKLTTTIKNGEMLAVPVLATRLAKLAQENSDDPTFVNMHRVISKFEDNKKHLISRALFTDLYNKHYVSGTDFASYFKDELCNEEPKASAKAISKDQAPLSLYSAADPVLANALGGLFGDKVAPFTKEAAVKAEKVVGSSLDLWNLSACKLSVAAGNDRFLVVQADYNTPKGITSVLVPVEMIAGKTMAPLVFVGNGGVKEINNANLKGYLTSFAGALLEVRASDVLRTLSVAGKEEREVGTVEMALIRMNAKDDGIMCTNSVLGQTLDPIVNDAVVSLPKAEGYEKLSAKLDTPMGLAVMKFGRGKVDTGRDVVCRSLVEMGVKNPQVAVAAVANDAIVYAVVGNGSGFNVPVRITDRVETPSVMICNGAIMPFEKKSLDKLGGGDIRAVAAVSPQYGLRNSDLIDNVRKAVGEGNYSKAEDALNVLASNGDKEAYKKGLDEYRAGLSGKKTISKCAFVVKSKSSNQPLCGHTGLPLSKVFQDKDGNCAPLYHREINENYVPAAINTYKVFGW